MKHVRVLRTVNACGDGRTLRTYTAGVTYGVSKAHTGRAYVTPELAETLVAGGNAEAVAEVGPDPLPRPVSDDAPTAAAERVDAMPPSQASLPPTTPTPRPRKRPVDGTTLG